MAMPHDAPVAVRGLQIGMRDDAHVEHSTIAP
jgi:hypothetical protein